MSQLLYNNVVTGLFEELHGLLKDYVFDTYTALATAIQAPLALMMVLSICILGIAVTQGWVRLSLGYFVRHALKLALIYLAALQWGWFSHNVYTLINEGASHLAAIIASATPIPLPHTSGEVISEALQGSLTEITKVGFGLWKLGSWHVIKPLFSAVIVWGFGFVFMMMAIFQVFLAKVMLAVLLSTAPVFIAFTVFKPTQYLFERWLGACIGYALVLLLVASVLALMLTLMQWAVAGLLTIQDVQINAVCFVPIMVVGFIGAGLLLRVSSVAQSIGGTVVMSSMTSSLGAALGAFIGGSFAAFQNKHSVEKNKNQSDASDKQQTSQQKIESIHLDIITMGGK